MFELGKVTIPSLNLKAMTNTWLSSITLYCHYCCLDILISGSNYLLHNSNERLIYFFLIQLEKLSSVYFRMISFVERIIMFLFWFLSEEWLIVIFHFLDILSTRSHVETKVHSRWKASLPGPFNLKLYWSGYNCYRNYYLSFITKHRSSI